MAIYQQSPGVQIIEKDASNVTVGLSSTIGAYVGAYRWGPVNNPMLISNEVQLATTFGQPDQNTYSHFFAAANFLAYTNAMWVNRVAVSGMANAVVAGTSSTLIKNHDQYESEFNTGISTVGEFAARYPGSLGSGIRVSLADAGTYAAWAYKEQFSAAPATSEYIAGKNGSNDELHIVVVDYEGKFSGTPGTILEKFGFVSKASDALSWEGLNNYYVNVLTNRSEYVYWLAHPFGATDGVTATNWGVPGANTVYKSLADIAGGAYDFTYTLTGGKDSSKYELATAAALATNVVTITYATTTTPKFTVGEVVRVSGFTPTEYNGDFVVTACTATSVSYALTGTNSTATVLGGVDSTNVVSVTDGELKLGWDVFVDTQTYDISLLVSGNASIELAAYVVQNIADVRRDCLAFTSITTTSSGAAEPIFASSTSRIADAKLFKTFDSTYAVIDSGFKYMYDKYNDKYRWIALNADTAGLCARVDATNDPWFSPAGQAKGQIKGAIKLSWNPSKAERDQLYPAAINPVINQVGQGTILFGDRTATTKPSAFDKINVRRMFLILEKSIANSAKYQLFEINDEITRLQFVSSIEPFLRDVKGRRGIKEFKVICDETNNTPQVISTNSFVGTILVIPNYSINYITLNFVAVGPNVEFSLAATV